jgi:hypothetical protein
MDIKAALNMVQTKKKFQTSMSVGFEVLMVVSMKMAVFWGRQPPPCQ